jgi:hypothetical protein
MTQGFRVVANVSILCAFATSALAAPASSPGASAADSLPAIVSKRTDQAVTRRMLDATAEARARLGEATFSPQTPDARSTVHTFDFWQESEPLTFPTRTTDATCTDLNGDGWPELIRLGIVYGDPYGGTMGVTLGGTYGMQGPELDTQHLASPKSVCAVDVNGDGRMDLVVAHLTPVPGTANQFTRNATFFIQTGAKGSSGFAFSSPAPTVVLAPGGELVRLTDVDGDQVADLVSVGTAHELYYQKGLGLTSGTPAVPLFDSQFVNVSKLAAQTAGLPAGSSCQFGFANDLAAGDFDGDGSTDFAVAAGGAFGGGLHVFYHRPAGWVYQGFLTASPTGAVARTITSLAVGDFDDDGRDDLVATSPAVDLITLLNNGSSGASVGPATSAGMSQVSSPGIGMNSINIVSADFNGDSLADVAYFDVTQQEIVTAYNPSTHSRPGVFVNLPAFYASYELQGTGLRALEASDVDLDGDLDLVGSYLASQSTAVLQNERLPNARKPLSVVALRGASAGGVVSDAFVPDSLEYSQSPNANSSTNTAAAAFTFQVSALQSDSLRLRIRLRALSPGVTARLGLLDRATTYVHWVLAAPLTTTSQEFEVVVPDAILFISSAQRVHICVQSAGSGETFRTAIDQISVEVIRRP